MVKLNRYGSVWDRNERIRQNDDKDKVEKLLNQLGKSIQDLVADGQLTEEQYGHLLTTINGLVKSGYIDKFDLSESLRDEFEGKRDSNVPIDLNSLASDVLAAIEGGAGTNFNLLSIPRDGSVSQRKTDFLKTGKNLIDDNDFKDGVYISPYTGSESTNSDYKTMRPFAVEAGTNITQNKSGFIAFYDTEGTFISGVDQTRPYEPRTLTVPSGASTAKTSISKTSPPIGNYQIEEGTESTEYEQYHLKISNLITEFKENQFEGNWIKNDTISKNKLNFEIPKMELTNNLYNKNDVQTGYYVNQSNGNIEPNSSHTTTHKMNTLPNEQYSFIEDSSLRIAHYDSSGNFISGARGPSSPITIPENTSYTIASFRNSMSDSFQFSKGEVLPDYEPYGYRFPGLLLKEGEGSILFTLPNKIYALVGQELNIYFDNIISGNDVDYEFDVVFGGNGEQFERFFRFVPDVAETRTLTLSILKDGQTVAQKSTQVIVSDATVGGGITRSAIVLGDSTTNNGVAVTKLNENFSGDAMNVETIGTRGTSPNNHEGRSGWTASRYINHASFGDVDNPFYNPTTEDFDFSYYMTDSGVSEPDYFIINLGINDLFSHSSDDSAVSKIDEVLADYETMIASIHAYNSNIKIGVALTIPPNYSQDGFAKGYGTGQTRQRYKRNNIMLVDKMIKALSGRESENIYLIPTNASIDTKYNFGFVDEPVNARNSTIVQRPTSNSGVHPEESGYWQIADMYWFWLKSFE